ncbi:MAG: 4-hydroxythreonine-4-phosphate dehydrogenase PdxA [Planctomycetaceae bacterium]
MWLQQNGYLEVEHFLPDAVTPCIIFSMASNQPSSKPCIGVTLGDVNGIGPEVAIRAMLDERVLGVCEPVVVGDVDICQSAVDLLGVAATVQRLDSPTPITRDGSIACWQPDSVEPVKLDPQQISGSAGRFAHDCLRLAARAAKQGQFAAICTAPLNKAALAEADVHFPGHTEILADEFGVSDFAMMLHLSDESLRGIRQLIGTHGTAPHGLAIAHVTLHTSIQSVPESLTSVAIAEKIQLVDRFLKRLGIDKPQVAVCALNPHGGEGGLFGSEEGAIVEPAVLAAKGQGVDAFGPFPTDTLIRRAMQGEFQGVVAMYHDQGHIPVKLIGFDRAVNVTLGIPIVRTSPTHGTAFDIAWQGQANAEGMIEAMQLAAQLAVGSLPPV